MAAVGAVRSRPARRKLAAPQLNSQRQIDGLAQHDRGLITRGRSSQSSLASFFLFLAPTLLPDRAFCIHLVPERRSSIFA
jgi:hypothetical protein